ncbi:hypothetical protein ACFRAR_12330 [Kitasatospora sp. NPDC056651]|uniref:hypothetical protein n=1 Tax=Kitasatospora sp. NPDC056651 TaxID=3345892 RepID=UPI0036C9835F
MRDGDLDLIHTPGLNFYNPTRVAAPTAPGLPFDLVDIPDAPTPPLAGPSSPRLCANSS